MSRAARRFREACNELADSDRTWTYIAMLGLTTASGIAGDLAGTLHAALLMEANHLPSIAFREPDLILARAWGAAAEGGFQDFIAAGKGAGV